MLIGRTDDPQNPRRVAALEADSPFGCGSRNPSGPAACAAQNRPDTRTQPKPDQIVSDATLAPKEPSTHALRGHAAEFGLVTAKGDKGVADLLEAASQRLPAMAGEALALLGGQIGRVEQELKLADAKLQTQHRASEVSKRLEQVPGVGWMTALTLSLRIDAARFESGRHLAAWLGLVPREHSTGGKQRLGAISRAGDERLRSLLVLGATAVIRHAKPGKSSPWLLSLLARKPRKVVAVALANKMARIAWAMMARGESYRQPIAA